MDIDNAAREGFKERSFDEAHVACEDDQLGAGCLEFLDQIGLDLFGKTGAEFWLVDNCRRDSKIFNQCENAGFVHIGCREDGGNSEMSRHDRCEDRAEVGTFSRTEDGNFQVRHEGGHIA